MRSDLKRRRRDAEEAEARLGEIEAKIAESQPKLGKVRRETAEYGERLAALKREAERELRALRVESGAAEAKLLACERNLSALNGAFEPLFYQLGEELNGRRAVHEDLALHYAALDNQLAELRDLNSELGDAAADASAVDTVALRWFWTLLAVAGLALAGAATAMLFAVW